MVKRKGHSVGDDCAIKKLKVNSNTDESFHEEDNNGKRLHIEEKNNAKKKLKAELKLSNTFYDEGKKGKGLHIEEKNNAKRKLKVESKLNETFHEEGNTGKRLHIEGTSNAKKKTEVDSNRKGSADEYFREENSKGKGLQVEEKDNVNKRKSKGRVKRAKKLKDCFSELPDHIVHHILGLLQNPKDAARTSILSKKWKTMWASFPIFDFDQRCFRPRVAGRNRRRSSKKEFDLENFKAVVSKSIATRLDAMPSIEKFRLYVLDCSTRFAGSMNYWILAAVTKNVKELNIHVHSNGSNYSLPLPVLSSKTITSLKLYGLKVVYAPAIELDNLRVLSIKGSPVSANMIGGFISNCPLLEDLRLVDCRGLRKVYIFGLPKLRRVELYKCQMLSDVEIDAPNLETFWFPESYNECKIRLVSCINLKSYTLKHSYITEELFQSQLSMYPNLEKLELLECTKLERITILSDKIKQLSFLRCFKLEEINIDTPYLTSLEYTGDKAPFSSMNIASLDGAKLNILSLKNKKKYFVGLESFLERFSQLKGFKLLVYAEKTLTIHEEFRGNMGRPSRTCKLELTKSLRKLRDLVVRWFSETSPSTLTVLSSSGSEILQFVQEMLASRKKNLDCCKYHQNKCWRHYLKDVEMCHETSEKRTYKLKWKP